MTKKIELLAPGGDIVSIKAAILGGANAIYCGLDKFNARNRAENINFADLNGILRLAHKNDCQVFLTLNIIIVESEIRALTNLLNRLINTKIDGVIVQDLGLFYLLTNYFPTLEIHASTQLTTHNGGQIQFLNKLHATRVNLSRELSLSEITSLTVTSHENNMLTEVFVHGSHCISFSGICYFSSVIDGKSGNRGRCSQPCREQYITTAMGKDYPLNLKDNCAYSALKDLSEAGVDSIKIEGRIKKFHYIYTVVHSWQKQLQRLYDNQQLASDDHDLHTVFNRGFTNGFLQDDVNKRMFSDNSRDNSAIYRAEKKGGATSENIDQAKKELYDLRTEIITNVKNKIDQLSIGKAPLTIRVSGKLDTPLKVSVQTPDTVFGLTSESNLTLKSLDGTGDCLNQEIFSKRLKAINDTEYFIEHLEFDKLLDDFFIPYRELTSISKKIILTLNDGKEIIGPITIPPLKNRQNRIIKPNLSLLISSQSDLHLCHDTAAEIHFQLPSSLASEGRIFLEIFRQNKDLIPWFPSILIGDDYLAAVEFLHRVQPKRIVTNNTGIAYEAQQKKIPWIAGPSLNIANSFSLLCLKDNFNCYGSFISNELKRTQITGIKKPANFKLYYSIFHPIVLLTSRQCLFQQVTGCNKSKLDNSCIQHCEKSASITNLKETTFLIKKTKGNYHKLYSEANFLNTDIVTDVPHLFASFFIDLRDIKTGTKIAPAKTKVAKLFENLLNEVPGSAKALKQNIYPTTSKQYKKGI